MKNTIIEVILLIILYIIIIIILLLGVLSVKSNKIAFSTDYTNEQIADAIYKAEGGKKAKVPYGVLSIKTNDPRGVCINTIKKQRIRHKKHDCNSDFITCLGNRYCPVSSDSKGNKNWVKNVKYFLESK